MTLFDFSSVVQPDLNARLLELVRFLGVVLICAWVMMTVYRRVSPPRTTDIEFSSTIFILTIAIGLLVMIIKQIPAISFGLFGAMSIVRFRTQIKQPRRMVFILMAVSLGVCCGAGEYMAALFATVILGAISLQMYAPNGDGLSSDAEVPTRPRPAEPAMMALAEVPVQSPVIASNLLSAVAGTSSWGIDLASRPSAQGRLWVLVVVDEPSRQILTLTPETEMTGKGVAQQLVHLSQRYGMPASVASETWPVFNGRRVLDWRQTTGVPWKFYEQAALGDQHLYAWSIARRVAVEDLNVADAATLDDLRDGLEAWRIQHNAMLAMENGNVASMNESQRAAHVGQNGAHAPEAIDKVVP